ncbi:MAG TPA: hypothetical protein VI548_06510 [Chitinophagaceae bacterium]|nr:hypothetical protein [Chitinophagaceae bacterium]
MKLFLSFIIAAVLFSISCNSNKDKITVRDADGNKATIDLSDVKDMAKSMEQNQSKAEALKKLTPLSLDQLKELIPEEFMGMKRSSFNTTNAMGFASCNAEYKSEDGKELKVELLDCAGELGANMYAIRFFGLWNYEEENDNGYQKTIDLNGDKAIEKFQKNNNQYNLTYFSNERLLVNLEGQNMGIDELKLAAKSLNLK